MSHSSMVTFSTTSWFAVFHTWIQQDWSGYVPASAIRLPSKLSSATDHFSGCKGSARNFRTLYTWRPSNVSTYSTAPHWLCLSSLTACKSDNGYTFRLSWLSSTDFTPRVVPTMTKGVPELQCSNTKDGDDSRARSLTNPVNESDSNHLSL